jgi:hypothetical protein
MVKIFTKVSVIMILAAFLWACTAATQVSGTWTKPGFNGKKFKKVVVIGMLLNPNAQNRATLENNMTADLQRYGVNAVSSAGILSPELFDKDSDGKIDDMDSAKAIFARKITESGADGALVISVKRVQDKTRYVPGSYDYYFPSSDYGYIDVYYFTTWNYNLIPGYDVTTTDVFTETNLYAVDKKELLYSVQSETVNPATLSDASKSLTDKISREMVESRIFLR